MGSLGHEKENTELSRQVVVFRLYFRLIADDMLKWHLFWHYFAVQTDM